MIWKLMTAVALGAALLAGSPARAAKAADAVAPTSETTAGTKRTPYIGWGGLGGYNVGISGGGSSTYFGFHVGGSANLLQITPELPLVGWGDAALTLGGDLF